MAAFAAFIPYIAAAAGTLLQGASAKGQANSQALQLEQQAGQDRAASQRVAGNEQRSARYLQSRVQALAAASGSGATDPSVLNIEADIGAQGEYNALTALYEGESSARMDEFGATVSRKTGKAAQGASYLKAAGTIIGGVSSWYDKYGGGGPSGADRAAGGAFTSTGRLRRSVSQGTSIADSPINSGVYA